MTSRETTSRPIQDVERRFRIALHQMQVAARQLDNDQEFEQLWFRLLTELLVADGGALWRPSDDSWQANYSVGRLNGSVTDLLFDKQHRRRMIAETATMKQPHTSMSSADGSIDAAIAAQTWIWFPICIFGEVRWVVEIIIAAADGVVSTACLKTIAAAVETLEFRQLLGQRREVESLRAAQLEERRIVDAFFVSLDLLPTAAVVANESRRVVDCDRATVLIRRGNSCRALSVSGQDDFDRRSRAIRCLELLAEQACRVGCVLDCPVTNDSKPQDFIEACERYVEHSDVKRLRVVPLFRGTAPDGSRSGEDPVPFAALILEWFKLPADEDAIRAGLAMIESSATRALDAAERYDEIFFASFWRKVGGLQKAWFQPGTRRRIVAIVGSIVALSAVVSFVPADFTVYCNGTLEPLVKRNVFAPSDAIVDEIRVAHGDHVVKDQVLIELRSTELEIAIAQATGQRTAAVEQLASIGRALIDEPRRSASERQARLSGQRTELRKRIAALDRELELYDDRRRSLRIVSPIDGEVTTWNTELLQHRPVRQGQMLISVARLDGQWGLQLQVPDARSGRVTEAARAAVEPLRVTYHMISAPGESRRASLTDIRNSVEVQEDEGSTVLVIASPDEDVPSSSRPGSAVAAHIYCGRRSLAYVWSRDLVDFLRSRVFFRWF